MYMYICPFFICKHEDVSASIIYELMSNKSSDIGKLNKL